MGQVLVYLPLVIAIGVVAVAVSSFFAFGGIWRNADAQFALGSYGMLLGIGFLLVFFSEDARQIDAFLNNLIVGQLCLLIGSTLLTCSLTGWGLRRTTVVLLVIANPILVSIMLALVTFDRPHIYMPLLALDAAGLIALGLMLARRQHQGQMAGHAVLLAVSSLLVVGLVYTFLGSHYRDGFGRVVGPPYLDGDVTILSLVLGLLIFIVDRVWSQGRPPQRAA